MFPIHVSATRESIFPYDYVYFKARTVTLELDTAVLFPYDYVYFKASFASGGETKTLNHFHTITSILKQYWVGRFPRLYMQFPYDYVYFKARNI